MGYIEQAISEQVAEEVESCLSNEKYSFDGDEWRGLDDYIRSQVENDDIILETIEGALNSMPDDPRSRCSVGSAFTEAVQTVLSDPDSVQLLRELLLPNQNGEPFGPFNPDVRGNE